MGGKRRRVQRLIRLAGAPCGLLAASSTAYLLTLTAAALLPRRRPTIEPASVLPRFDLLAPAHNEAATLPRLLASVAALDYPPSKFQLHVVADNCTDATAAVARAAGAVVYERVDPARVGKGYALTYGLSQILAREGRDNDGVVIIDADSEVAPDFLRVLARYLQGGAQAIQAYYSVQNAGASDVAMLRYVALCLYHYLRPLGRARLGLSAGLRGNGMAFSRAVAAAGWDAFGLTEDIEQHFRLLERGVHVAFAPEAVVRAEMPVTFGAAASQNSRWERGRLAALAVEVPRLLRLAVRRRDPSALDAAFEQLVPPLSICVAAALAATLAGAAGRSRRLLAAGLFGGVGQLAYVFIGLRLAGAPAGAASALATAPRYVLWKGAVWVRAAVRPPDRWQRTARVAEQRGDAATQP